MHEILTPKEAENRMKRAMEIAEKVLEGSKRVTGGNYATVQAILAAKIFDTIN